MLLVSGLTTILHTFLGSRLPLIQGSSFVYLAPALVIANSEEFRNLSEDVCSNSRPSLLYLRTLPQAFSDNAMDTLLQIS